MSRSRPGTICAVLLAGLLAGPSLLASAPGAPPFDVASSRRAPELDALFRRTTGWTGGDGDYSIRLDRDRLLWLFGDSWIGPIRDGRHDGASLVNNAVAVQSLSGNRAARPVACWGPERDGKPTAFFVPRRRGSWYWPLHGHRCPDALHLFAVRIERTDRPDAFGFRAVGSHLLSLADPDAPPSTWPAMTRHRPLPFARFTERGNVLFGGAVAAAGPWLYVFGTDERRLPPPIRRTALVARVPLDRVDAFGRWRFWNGATWSPSYLDARPLFDRVANEFSVARLPDGKTWIAVTTDNGLSDEIHGRFAPAPEGPWSTPLLLHRCAEGRERPGIFTYAAKLHPDLQRRPEELVLSYVTNCSDFERLARDASLYWPLFVRVRLEKVP